MKHNRILNRRTSILGFALVMAAFPNVAFCGLTLPYVNVSLNVSLQTHQYNYWWDNTGGNPPIVDNEIATSFDGSAHVSQTFFTNAAGVDYKAWATATPSSLSVLSQATNHGAYATGPHVDAMSTGQRIRVSFENGNIPNYTDPNTGVEYGPVGLDLPVAVQADWQGQRTGGLPGSGTGGNTTFSFNAISYTGFSDANPLGVTGTSASFSSTVISGVAGDLSRGGSTYISLGNGFAPLTITGLSAFGRVYMPLPLYFDQTSKQYPTQDFAFTEDLGAATDAFAVNDSDYGIIDTQITNVLEPVVVYIPLGATADGTTPEDAGGSAATIYVPITQAGGEYTWLVAVPEPGSLGVVGMGMVMFRRRRAVLPS